MNGNPTDPSSYYIRITLQQRLLHGTMMLSFLGLAASGMPLRFNQSGWASSLANAVGGFGAILFFHKTFAFLLTLCFVVHVGSIIRTGFIQGDVGIFWGPRSMVPQPRDLTEMTEHFRWFFGFGPKPRFGRFTYWEKFDYWAVFWGMLVIGISGYVMWFSSFFGRYLPGWLFNIALLIHAEEALLAVWFIFTIHFFNSHLRPDKFPMDLVIFTGRVSEEELKHERPAEHDALVAAGRLEKLRTEASPLWLNNFGKIIGFSAVVTGFLLFGLTLLAFLHE